MGDAVRVCYPSGLEESDVAGDGTSEMNSALVVVVVVVVVVWL